MHVCLPLTAVETRRHAQALRLLALAGGRALRPYLAHRTLEPLSEGESTAALAGLLAHLRHYADAAGVDFTDALMLSEERHACAREGLR